MSELASIHAPLAVSVAAVGVYPDLSGVGGAGQLESVIGALMSIVLVVAVLMIAVCAAAWAVCAAPPIVADLRPWTARRAARQLTAQRRQVEQWLRDAA